MLRGKSCRMIANEHLMLGNTKPVYIVVSNISKFDVDATLCPSLRLRRICFVLWCCECSRFRKRVRVRPFRPKAKSLVGPNASESALPHMLLRFKWLYLGSSFREPRMSLIYRSLWCGLLRFVGGFRFIRQIARYFW